VLGDVLLKREITLALPYASMEELILLLILRLPLVLTGLLTDDGQ
jgi:hypothetical protein